MSLLQRVSSIESFSPQRGRSLSPHSSINRKLSFSPLPARWDPLSQNPVPTIGAFEVPKTKRILQVASAILYCLCAAGIVFGYAALKPVLIREHVYRDLCTQDELDRDVRTCFAQEIHLNLMFTIAAVGTNVAALPVGAVLDHFGPRVCGVLGSAFLATGTTLFAFAWDLPVDTFMPGYLFLALGGPFIFISSFQLSNAFPKHSGLILALLTGAFDTSSAVFLIYRILYQWSDGTLWPKQFFLRYLMVPVLILTVQLTLMPQQSYKTVGELVKTIEDSDMVPDDQIDEHTALLREEMEALRNHRQQHRGSVVSEIAELLGSKSGSKQARQEEQKQKISGVWGVLHGQTVQQQILSSWFILITLFTVLQMTRINYFVATVRCQYEYLLHSYDKAVAINNFFDAALPLGGIISIPFIGLVLDNTTTPFVLTSLVTIATTIGILGILPYTWAAYANVSLFVLYRPFYYTAVSDYAAKVFGFRTFGTVYGFIICLAGLFNFSQSGLDTLTHKTFHKNPVPVNLALTGATLVVGAALVLFVRARASHIRRTQLAEEAELAHETAMPGSGNGNSGGIFFSVE